MEITERLRNTPTGFTVKVGEINIHTQAQPLFIFYLNRT